MILSTYLCSFDKFSAITVKVFPVRLNLPLEYNIGYEEYNDIHGITSIPHPDFWKIAAHEGCTAIIGVDAHNNQYLENPFYYNRATETLRKLGIKVIDRISFFNEK